MGKIDRKKKYTGAKRNLSSPAFCDTGGHTQKIDRGTNDHPCCTQSMDYPVTTHRLILCKKPILIFLKHSVFPNEQNHTQSSGNLVFVIYFNTF